MSGRDKLVRKVFKESEWQADDTAFDKLREKLGEPKEDTTDVKVSERKIKELEKELHDLQLEKADLDKKHAEKDQELLALDNTLQKLREKSLLRQKNQKLPVSQLEAMKLEDEPKEQQSKALRKLKRKHDLYRKISGMVLDHTTEPHIVKGCVMTGKDHVDGFIYDLKQESEFAVCNNVWELIGKDSSEENQTSLATSKSTK